MKIYILRKRVMPRSDLIQFYSNTKRELYIIYDKKLECPGSNWSIFLIITEVYIHTYMVYNSIIILHKEGLIKPRTKARRL